jgi:hypothetical protein
VLAIGTYNRKAAVSETLYLRVGAAGAPRAAEALRQYGFKVLAIHPESNLKWGGEDYSPARLQP